MYYANKFSGFCALSMSRHFICLIGKHTQLCMDTFSDTQSSSLRFAFQIELSPEKKFHLIDKGNNLQCTVENYTLNPHF